ncbi:MAG: undecaprenyldiphospho-muramoylpentapeptide beta-N-acetylglucosaminyltransferase [Natronospirillum sp.]
MSKPRILIMAGGTGGHVFPGLAVADRLRELGHEINWLGTGRGIENELVPAADYPLHRLTVTGVRGSGPVARLLAPFRIAQSIWQAMRILRAFKPAVVLGLGGYASGPGGIAARLMRIPLVIHEQNAVAGTTNKLLSRFANAVLCGSPKAFAPNVTCKVVGNPVRASMGSIAPPAARGLAMHAPLRLLVLGGSQGAQAINQLVPAALKLIPVDQRPSVRHQAGKANVESTQVAYSEANVSADIVPFIADMAEALSQADLVIARAGALTVAEIAAVGVSSVLIPFPYAIDDHQTENARSLVELGAATVLPQADLTAGQLAQVLREQLQPEALLNRAAAARAAGKPDATEQVVRELQNWMGEKA